jgi:hypothetical protein
MAGELKTLTFASRQAEIALCGVVNLKFTEGDLRAEYVPASEVHGDGEWLYQFLVQEEDLPGGLTLDDVSNENVIAPYWACFEEDEEEAEEDACQIRAVKCFDDVDILTETMEGDMMALMRHNEACDTWCMNLMSPTDVASWVGASVGGTTVGNNLLNLANPSAITFLRINADNSVDALNAADMLTALGVGTTGVYQSTVLVAGRVALSNGTGAITDSANFLYAPTLGTGGLTIANTTASTSVSTGALIVAGGAGIATDSWISTLRIGRGVSAYTTNTIVGVEGLGAINNATAIHNSVFGYRAGKAITSGAQNTLLGDSAGLLLANGGANVAIGYLAMSAGTSCGSNVAVGVEALNAVTTQGENTAIGRYALNNNTAIQNTGVGANAGQQNTTGIENTYLGYNAGYTITTGSSNTAIGLGALSGPTGTTNNCIAIGVNACGQNTSGGSGGTLLTNSIFIGNGTDYQSGDDNVIVIGHGADSEGDNKIVIGNSSHTVSHIFGVLTLGVASTTVGEMQLKNATNANTLNIKSGVTSSSWTLTLPTTDGVSGEMLETDGAGVTTWTNPRNITENAQLTAYTMVLTDAHKIVTINSALGNNWTVPSNAAVAFPVGTRIYGAQLGVGLVTVAAAGGVTIYSRGSLLASAGQYARWDIVKIATDTWILTGDLA